MSSALTTIVHVIRVQVYVKAQNFTLPFMTFVHQSFSYVVLLCIAYERIAPMFP